MHLKQLRYFLEVADSGSFTRAARHLGLAQPALSLQIRHLEEELHAQLLHRHARGVTLTEAGEQLFACARGIVDQLDGTCADIKAAAGAPVGQVRLGLPTTIVGGLLRPLIAATRRRYPGIEINAVEGMSGNLADQIQLGKIDVAMLFDPSMIDGLHADAVVEEDLCLIGPVNAAAMRYSALQFADLAGLELVLPSREHTIRRMLDTMASRQGIALDVRHTVDSFQGLVDLARSDYFTVLPRFCLQREAQGNLLGAVAIIRPAITWRLYVVHPDNRVLSRASQAIIELIPEVCRSLVETGQWPGRLPERDTTV
jgi:DNA-binding transcriptional LysR family regulator